MTRTTRASSRIGFLLMEYLRKVLDQSKFALQKMPPKSSPTMSRKMKTR